MNKQCTLIVSAAALASVVVSGCCMGRCGARPTSNEKTLLVVPGVQSMVDLGFDLLEMNSGALDLACYKGADKVEAFEFFDRHETKWVHVDEDQWKTASYPIDRYANAIVVGSGAAHDHLAESASWAKTVLTPDGRRLHEVANAVDSLLPLSSSQWKTLASKHGLTIKSQPAPSRYGSAPKNRNEVSIPETSTVDHTLKSPFEGVAAEAATSDKTEAPAVEAPAVEAPEVEVETPAAPAVEVPAVEAPAAPAVEAPAAPAVEAPAVEAPATVEVPAVEVSAAPAVEAPAAVEAPVVEAPTAPAAPAVEAPVVEVPAVEVPEVPVVEAPAVEAKPGEITTFTITGVVAPEIEVVEEAAASTPTNTPKLVTVVVPASELSPGDRIFLPGGKGADTNAVEAVPAK